MAEANFVEIISLITSEESESSYINPYQAHSNNVQNATAKTNMKKEPDDDDTDNDVEILDDDDEEEKEEKKKSGVSGKGRSYVDVGEYDNLEDALKDFKDQNIEFKDWEDAYKWMLLKKNC